MTAVGAVAVKVAPALAAVAESTAVVPPLSVCTQKPDVDPDEVAAVKAPAMGALVRPVKVNDNAAELAIAQPLLSVVSVTVSIPEDKALGVRSLRTQAVPVNPVSAVTVGVPENPVGNPISIFPVLLTAPDADAVKFTVQLAVVLCTRDDELNDTPVRVVALAIVAVPRSTIAKTMAPAVILFTRLMGLKRDEPSCPTTE